MKKFCVCAQVVAAALAGCSTAPGELAPTRYSDYDCAQITAEERRMYALADVAVKTRCDGTPVPLIEEATSVASAE